MIQTIRGLCTGATTKINHNGGIGENVHINRGTIQGDSLSPLLFIIYIEPLHRWLRAGGRGYKQGCLNKQQQTQYNTSSLGYADDTCVLTNTVANLKAQCQKVENVNVKKCKCKCKCLTTLQRVVRLRKPAVHSEVWATITTWDSHHFRRWRPR